MEKFNQSFEKKQNNSEKKPLNREELEILINLRKKQISGNLTPEESKIIKEFNERAEYETKNPLSKEEYQEFLELSRCQIEGISPLNHNEKWNINESYVKRLKELRERLEKFGKV